MLPPERYSSIFDSPQPSRKSRIETYLWDNSGELSKEFAKKIHNPDRPIQPFGVLIPVAAHQESGRILKTMEQYALQESAEPFSIILSLNSPSDADVAEVLKTIAAVKQAQTTFSQLDIRYFSTDYENPTIGKIRKDLWDAAARVALKDGLFDRQGIDFIGINHDIDTEKIGKHYIRNIQRHYAQLQTRYSLLNLQETVLPSRYTQVSHLYPSNTHPNIARAIFWEDFTARQYFRNGAYEEGLVVPLTRYAESGGFHAGDVTYETKEFSPFDYKGIPRTLMKTSPRRYVARLSETAIGNIWSNDSFGPNDLCRENALSDFRDITRNELEARIFDSLEHKINMFTNMAAPPEFWARMTRLLHGVSVTEKTDPTNIHSLEACRSELISYITPRLLFARRILGRLGLSSIAELLDESEATNIARAYENEILKSPL